MVGSQAHRKSPLALRQDHANPVDAELEIGLGLRAHADARKHRQQVLQQGMKLLP